MVIKTVGSDSIRSQFLFINTNLHNQTHASMQKHLGDAFRIVRNQIEDGQLTSYTAFFETPFNDTGMLAKSSYIIPGNINWLSVHDVESVLNEKIKHSSPEYRKKGMVSTHPPKFLTPETVVVVMGSIKFLLRNMQLYLEQEGILRDQTFELLIEIACLKVACGRRQDDFLHVFIQDKAWYRGNVEALADLASKRYRKEENETAPVIMSDAQLLKHLKIVW